MTVGRIFSWLGMSILASLLGFLVRVEAQEMHLSEDILEVTNDVLLMSRFLLQKKKITDKFADYVYFADGVDRAATARTFDGKHCYAVYSATRPNFYDWLQNFAPFKRLVCGPQGCCPVRSGWYNAYHASFREEVEKNVRSCVEQCREENEGSEDCLVLGGFSQGAAISAIAGVYLADLNPLGIIAGAPRMLVRPCWGLQHDRWYRFISTREVDFYPGVVYDFFTQIEIGFRVRHLGHGIILSKDDTGVAYLGLDDDTTFRPIDPNILATHSMRAYIDLIDPILERYRNDTAYNFPVLAAGFREGTRCTKNKECMSGWCSLIRRTCA